MEYFMYTTMPRVKQSPLACCWKTFSSRTSEKEDLHKYARHRVDLNSWRPCLLQWHYTSFNVNKHLIDEFMWPGAVTQLQKHYFIACQCHSSTLQLFRLYFHILVGITWTESGWFQLFSLLLLHIERLFLHHMRCKLHVLVSIKSDTLRYQVKNAFGTTNMHKVYLTFRGVFFFRNIPQGVLFSQRSIQNILQEER